MNVVLISPYELGRQPFGLAQPAAWLRRAGFEVRCVDLSVETLEPEPFRDAALVAIHLAMHTATRIALEALPKIRELAPGAALCAYGLYAPTNSALLAEQGFEDILGGESEPDLVTVAQVLRDRTNGPASKRRPRPYPQPIVNLGKIDFLVPDRKGLADLSQYASLILPDGKELTAGFAEGSRGCKHRCRHCPVVPTYNGRFRIVPVPVVIQDIQNQVDAGAQHISFGDPDFFNGPTHARRLVEAFAARFPTLGFDCTIKVEHLLAHRELLGLMVDAGCRFVTTAVEAVDDAILERLDKGHTVEDFKTAVELARNAGLALAPTFVPFTPWTSLDGYCRLLDTLAEMKLVTSVPPVQLAIRLLVPGGSRLLELEDFAVQLDPFDPVLLGHRWHHPDPRVDRLQEEVQAIAATADHEIWSRDQAFTRIREAAYRAAGRPITKLPDDLGPPIARHSEPWYCCAEPTTAQLEAI